MEVDVRIITFGIKYGRFPKADLYFDCQVFTDPGHLSHKNGFDQAVQLFLTQKISTVASERTAYRDILYVARQVALAHAAENTACVKSEPMTIALFCYGGRHRSVGVSEMIKRTLESDGLSVSLSHLDVFRRKASKHAYRKVPETCKEKQEEHFSKIISSQSS